MNPAAFAVPLLSFAVLLLAGCAEQPAPTTLTAAAGPSDSEANALVQKHLTALGAGLDLCLKDFAWPVTEDLTLGRDSAQPNVDSAEDLRLMQELETVGLAKSVVIRQALTVNNTPVQVYSISYSLTPAAAPWLKDVSSPDFTKGGKQVPHKAICFGKIVATHVQVLHARLDAKDSQATAWKNDMDGLTRAYVRYTEEPDHRFADVEADIKKATHVTGAKGSSSMDKQEAAFQKLREHAGAYSAEPVLYLERDGNSPWQALTEDAAVYDMTTTRNLWPAAAAE
jgi:hypothetical protein